MPNGEQVLNSNHDLSRHAPLVQLAASWSARSVQRLSGPGQDQPPRIDPWAVSIANVLDGDACEQEPEQFTTLCHGPCRPGSRRVDHCLHRDCGGVLPVLGESLAGSSATITGQQSPTVYTQVRPHMPVTAIDPQSCTHSSRCTTTSEALGPLTCSDAVSGPSQYSVCTQDLRLFHLRPCSQHPRNSNTCGLVCVWPHVAIGVEGGHRTGVPKPLLDNLHVSSRSDEQ